MVSEETIREQYSQFQYLQQHIEQISQHVELLSQQKMELEISINAVQELGKVPLQQELLAPIANGIFFKARLQDNQDLIVNVGSNVTVEKKVSDVVRLLEQQQQEISGQLQEAEAVLQELSQQALARYKEIEKHGQGS